MPFQQNDDLRFFTFDSLSPSVSHAVFTRRGGVSPAPWDSLNVGGGVGDEAVRVRANRVRLFEAAGRDPASIFDVWQVHSADVVSANAPRSADAPYQQADVILTDRPDVTLFMRFADCVPILLHDPRRGVIGLVHAGWLGTVRDAAGAAVRAMQGHYGSNPPDILAAIGPSICMDHYEVGADVLLQVMQAYGDDARGFLHSRNGRVHLDLWAANRWLLARAGVGQIEMAGLCTACRVEDWYSHRAERGRTGRFGVLMALQ